MGICVQRRPKRSAALEADAAKKGKTADEVGAVALKRYLAHEKLGELARYGEERMRTFGLDALPADQRDEFVNRVIEEYRTETRVR